MLTTAGMKEIDLEGRLLLSSRYSRIFPPTLVCDVEIHDEVDRLRCFFESEVEVYLQPNKKGESLEGRRCQAKTIETLSGFSFH